MKTLHWIAIFEVLKGVTALILSTILYLNIPLPAFLSDIIKSINPLTLIYISYLALAYSLLRFAEAYGLWFKKPWGLKLAFLSGAIYLPFEAWEIYKGFSFLKILAIGLNIMIIIYLWRNWRVRRTSS